MRAVETTTAGVSERHNIGETTKITLSANGELLRVLVDKIYAHKEKTAVRELIANALDSHAKAGIPERAIEVHLPTILEPNFIVRDFGVGMSHDFIMKNYSQLGESTKRNSNAETGYFGVGSKSPLSISDSFTVKAYDEDSVRLYIVDKSGNELEIQHTITAYPPPGEKFEQGIEVIVPVDPANRKKVLEGLSNQHFCWFDKNIKFHGAYDEGKHELYAAISQVSPGFYLAIPRTSYSYSSGWNVFVRQGAAVYPLDRSEIESTSVTGYSHDLVRKLSDLCSSGRHVLIDVPIGTADVTISRESISYNTQTTNNLRSGIQVKYDAFALTLKTLVGDARDYKTATERIYAAWCDAPLSPMPLSEYRFYEKFTAFVRDYVVSNAEEHHKTLPLVEVEESDWQTDGAGVNGWVTTKKLGPAPFVAPVSNHQLSQGNFAERKAQLYGGTFVATHELNKDRQLEIRGCGGNGKSGQPLYAPFIAFVLPTAAYEWHTRVGLSLTKLFAKRYGKTQPNREVPFVVVRVPKRLLEDAKVYLKTIVADIEIYEEKHLPPPSQEAKKREQRTYSKTTAYEYDRKNYRLGTDKIEPDYTQPAYYLARVTQSDKFSLADPTALSTVNTSILKPSIEAYALATLIKTATTAGLLNAQLPIYRLSDRQAEKTARVNKHWIHLPTQLLKDVDSTLEAEYAKNGRPLNEDSAFIDELDSTMKTLVRVLVDPRADSRRLYYDSMRPMLEDDYLVYTLCLYWSKEKDLLANKRVQELTHIRRQMVITDDNTALKLPATYELLPKEAMTRYEFLINNIAAVGASVNRLRHAEYYLKGYRAAHKNLNTKIAEGAFPILDPYAKRLRDHIKTLYQPPEPIKIMGTQAPAVKYATA